MFGDRYWRRGAYATAITHGVPPAVIAWMWAAGVPGAAWWLGAGALAFVLTAYGYAIGHHHTFAHRAFAYPRPIELALIYAATLSASVSPISWTVNHVAHHRHADTEHDPHAPSRLGWRTLLLTAHRTDRPGLIGARHLLRDPAQRFADGPGFWAIALTWPALMFAVSGPTGLVMLWALPVWYAHAVSLAFVFAHVGARDERSRSRAVNSAVLNALSFGDGGHLDHHRDARSCGRWTRRLATFSWT